MQVPGNTYASHTGVLFNHTNRIDSNIKSVRLETLIDYALDTYKAFEETETLGDLTPEFLWTDLMKQVKPYTTLLYN